MKEMVSIRSNPFYIQEDKDKVVTFVPLLELIIIHTDGKEYNITKNQQLTSKTKLSEYRLLVSPKMLAEFITDLQLHQQKLDGITRNANQINALITHLSTPLSERTEPKL